MNRFSKSVKALFVTAAALTVMALCSVSVMAAECPGGNHNLKYTPQSDGYHHMILCSKCDYFKVEDCCESKSGTITPAKVVPGTDSYSLKDSRDLTAAPGKHYHTMQCLCGDKFTVEEAHIMQNGSCSLCGYTQPQVGSCKITKATISKGKKKTGTIPASWQYISAYKKWYYKAARKVTSYYRTYKISWTSAAGANKYEITAYQGSTRLWFQPVTGKTSFTYKFPHPTNKGGKVTITITPKYEDAYGTYSGPAVSKKVKMK